MINMAFCSRKFVLRTLLLLTLGFCIIQTYVVLGIPVSYADSHHRRWSNSTSSWDDTSAAQPVGQQIMLPQEQATMRMNATFVSLVRNSELSGMLSSIRNVEDRFNRDWQYDWVFLNDEDFTEEFKTATTAFTSGRARYGKVAKEHWSFPEFINQDQAKATRERMAGDEWNMPYGESESYRHMCRYQSGFFYRHELVSEYQWYWRVEPNIELLCDIDYDPFRWMAENGKKYGFVITLNELGQTVPSLWKHVKDFMQKFPQHIVDDNHMNFLSEDKGDNWSYCHFWSNFEIANLDWYRSQAYNDFFEYLDKAGGFFYERWGDAPIHTIAAALTLKKGEIHFFDDIGYHHAPTYSCPRSAEKRLKQKCMCSVQDLQPWNPSCLKRFHEATDLPFPEGYDRDVPREVGLEL